MSIFKKKSSMTSEDTTSIAVGRLADDIVCLQVDKENAISSFRRTANELADINKHLGAKIQFFDSIIAMLSEQSKTAKQMVEDNLAVRDKILDIIGGE